MAARRRDRRNDGHQVHLRPRPLEPADPLSQRLGDRDRREPDRGEELREPVGVAGVDLEGDVLEHRPEP